MAVGGEGGGGGVRAPPAAAPRAGEELLRAGELLHLVADHVDADPKCASVTLGDASAGRTCPRPLVLVEGPRPRKRHG